MNVRSLLNLLLLILIPLFGEAAPPPEVKKIDICTQILISLAWSSGESAASWEKLSDLIRERFQTSVNEGYPENNFEVGYKAFRSETESHLQGLKKLGIDLESDPPVIPHVKVIFDNYFAEMRKHIGNVPGFTEADILHPKFIFDAKDGSSILVAFGEPVPEGYTLRIGNGIIPGGTWNDHFAEGNFVVGHVERTQTGIPSFEHDLGHLTGFMEDPVYQMDLAKLFKRSKADKARGRQNTLHGTRSYFLTESYAEIVPQKKTELLSKLSLPPNKSVEELTYDELLAYNSSLPLETLLQKQNELMAHYTDYVRVLGGASRDMHSIRGNYLLHDLLHTQTYAIEAFRNNPEFTAIRAPNIIKAITEKHFALAKLSLIERKDWFDLAFRQDVPAESPIAKHFCAHPIWGEMAYREFKAFCRD